jgi:hypothetical protein
MYFLLLHLNVNTTAIVAVKIKNYFTRFTVILILEIKAFRLFKKIFLLEPFIPNFMP